MVKLLPCDLVVMDSSWGNNLLHCMVKLHTIDLSPFDRFTLAIQPMEFPE